MTDENSQGTDPARPNSPSERPASGESNNTTNNPPQPPHFASPAAPNSAGTWNEAVPPYAQPATGYQRQWSDQQSPTPPPTSQQVPGQNPTPPVYGQSPQGSPYTQSGQSPQAGPYTQPWQSGIFPPQPPYQPAGNSTYVPGYVPPPYPQGAPLGYAPGVQLSSWGKRAIGGLVDYVAPSIIASTINNTVANTPAAGGVSALLGLAQLGFWIWNSVYLGGLTGWTIGRRIAKVRLVDQATGAPIGIGLSLVRQLGHIVDSVFCLIGWFFPIWDSRRQTIADKLVSTVVIDTPVVPARLT